MALLNGLTRGGVSAMARAAGQRALSSSCLRRGPVLLSRQFIPTLRSDALSDEQLESVKLLLRGGYIRQSSSGFYSLLPVGLRVVKKIEAIIDEEMDKVGAFDSRPASGRACTHCSAPCRLAPRKWSSLRC